MIGVLFLLLLALVVTLGPLVTLWALNTLFPILAIPYTFWTWLAALILGSVVRFSRASNTD